jgi:DNA-binding CsgD family transcriptional regulator
VAVAMLDILSQVSLTDELYKLTRRELHILAPAICCHAPHELLSTLSRRSVAVVWLHGNAGSPGAVPCEAQHAVIVRDREVIYVPYACDGPQWPQAWVRLSIDTLALSLVRLFQDRSVGPVAGPGVLRLTPDQCAMLAVLAEGHTDERAALRLGMSNRTFARRIADLMVATGVRSRFQLGVQAVKQGLI